MERDCESELSKLNIEQNACIYHFGASVIHGQRSNILRLRFMKLSRGYEKEQHTLQIEQTSLKEELQKKEKQSVDIKQFLSVVRKYTDLTELTPEIVHEFIDKIIVHAPDKSSGKRLQEIEIIYNHIGVFDHSKVTLWKGKAV